MDFKDIFIVIVLYKMTLEDSLTIETLKYLPNDHVNLMVFDNGPVRQYKSSIFRYRKFNIHYYHAASNPGLSYAYNLALGKATKTNKTWLLLLDQDTVLTNGYINEILDLRVSELSNDVVSIMPRVFSVSGNKIIAPSKMFKGGFSRPVQLSSGIVKAGISGINSGTLLNVFFMNSIDGFSVNFSLDMLDHWYFREIKIHNKYIYLLNNYIKQNLSVFVSFEENVSVLRYRQLINAEYNFVQTEGIVSLLFFRARLIFRGLKQITYKNKDYCRISITKAFSFN